MCYICTFFLASHDKIPLNALDNGFVFGSGHNGGRSKLGHSLKDFLLWHNSSPSLENFFLIHVQKISYPFPDLRGRDPMPDCFRDKALINPSAKGQSPLCEPTFQEGYLQF
jgi:hypothetical protein